MIRQLITLAYCALMTPLFSYDEEAKEELFPSTSEQVASLSNEPSYLVGGIISPLSGQPVLRETDLVVKGAQDIILSRVYVPPSIPCSFGDYKQNREEHHKYDLFHYLAHHYKGWQFYPHLKLKFTHGIKEILLTDPNGASLIFRLSGKNFSTATISSSDGLSNASGDTPSGKYDSRNTRISYEENGNRIIVYATDGVTRFYHLKQWLSLTETLYLLEKEILSNGKVLKYHYGSGGELELVESLDPKERFVYASLRIQGSSWWKKGYHFVSPSGLTADYAYQRRPFSIRIKEKEKHWYGDNKIDAKYNYLCPPILTSVSSPFYRDETLDYDSNFLLSPYLGKDECFQASYQGFGTQNLCYRVNRLSLPVGPNDAFVPVYELSYQPVLPGKKEGSTTVKNSDGTTIVYHFSKSLLSASIQYFGQEGGLKKEKVLFWDNQNWLKALEIRDEYKNVLYRKSYEYDRFGNPIVETFTGNLTGGGDPETYTIRRTFSTEGRNLLLREETEEGKVVCFSYLPNTDLITSKLIKDKDKIIRREFSLYDDCYNLIQTVSDDGTGENSTDLSCVNQRHVTTYTLRQLPPFLHMPEWITDTYWESGVENPLQKRHLIYDQHGNIVEEEIYDSDGKRAYTIYKTYNERGDILSETNCLGQTAFYTYDRKGRPETATNFSQRTHRTYRYDLKGRVRELTEKGDDGIKHTVSSDYDLHDRKIQQRDPFSNSTYYAYDLVVNEVIKTDFPSILSVDGRSVPVSTASTYDSFGREKTKTDPNGNITIYRYNAYGSPTEILHPNGGKELFRYAKNGQLISHTDCDGLTIRYQRDVLGRVLSKSYFATDNQKLAEEFFTYNGFNLLTETDKEGNLRRYSYDGVGRKIREEFCGQITDFSYDSLGWLATICKHNGDNTLLVHYKRDLEGKILEECKTDASGYVLYKVKYSYDKDGNQETITRSINGQEAVELFVYDSFGRLIQHQDAEGFITRTAYDEGFINPLGQKVLQKRTVDPRQMTILETEDALSRSVEVKKLNSEGATVVAYNLTYDPQGNLLYRKDHVYEGDHFRNTQIVQYTYTPDHQIKSLTRGFGTKDARVTSYTYFSSGRIATKTLPDGVTLTYQYHPLGFLSQITSSDGKIRHAFEYNRLGYLYYALDENQNSAIRREVNPFGKVVREVFPHGLEAKKEYDSFQRLTSLKIANQGEIAYTYDSLFLRRVARISKSGEILYSHSYKDYDLAGNLITESLIGNLGDTTHAKTPRGYQASLSSPYFVQNCSYDSVGNLVTNVVDQAEHRYSYDATSQLSIENGPKQSVVYAHDSVYNRVQKDCESYEVNDLSELVSLDGIHNLYDLNGNQVLRKNGTETSRLSYDPFNQLTEVTAEKKKVSFIYDPLCRRLSKIVCALSAKGWEESDREDYLYDDQNEIGAFTSLHEPKNLRVLGLASHKDNPTTVGIEIKDQTFAPLLDVQGNIRRLVDVKTRSVIASYDFTAFGEALQENLKEKDIPWRFASKRFDPELSLIYFGKRYYDPRLGRWLTTDPAGFVDSVNLYQYVLNNPFRFQDLRGESLGGYLLGLGEIICGGALMLTGGIIEIGSLGTLTVGFVFAESAGIALIGHGLTMTTTHAKDISFEKSYYIISAEKKHNPDQEALSDIVKGAGKKGVSNADADTLLDWAKEYNFPHRDDRGKPHWDAKGGMDHIHLGPKHIPVNN